MKKQKDALTRRIIYLRKEKGFTQETFAEKLEITLDTLKSYESCKSPWKLYTIEKIAEVFDVSADYMLFGKVQKNNLIFDNLDDLDLTILQMSKHFPKRDKKMIIDILAAVNKRNAKND